MQEQNSHLLGTLFLTVEQVSQSIWDISQVQNSSGTQVITGRSWLNRLGSVQHPGLEACGWGPAHATAPGGDTPAWTSHAAKLQGLLLQLSLRRVLPAHGGPPRPAAAGSPLCPAPPQASWILSQPSLPLAPAVTAYTLPFKCCLQLVLHDNSLQFFCR